MILKGSQRGGARQLAIHLLRTDENDHVELHEVRGFISDDLGGALREAYAVSKGTRCEQFLFSLSLSPPETAEAPVSVFEDAIEDIEAKLGLTGQPRVVIFHEKNGRRHAHCVWSRIDAEAMKAINLPHFKLKLRDVSRELYLEHGWRMPSGLANSAERDPRNFSLEEWQQAKRAERDPRELKELLQDCWAISDSGKAFAQALESRGLYLARGDRRGFVALDIKARSTRSLGGPGSGPNSSRLAWAILPTCAASTRRKPMSPACSRACWGADWPKPKRSIVPALHRCCSARPGCVPRSALSAPNSTPYSRPAPFWQPGSEPPVPRRLSRLVGSPDRAPPPESGARTRRSPLPPRSATIGKSTASSGSSSNNAGSSSPS